MQTHHFLVVLLLVLFFTVKFSFAQNEIERYKQPDLIEGSNLIINAAPYYANDIYNDSTKRNRFNISARFEFTKWRYTQKLDYSVYVSPGFFTTIETSHDNSGDYTYKSTSATTTFRGGLNYYPFKKLSYSGFYCNSRGNFSSSSEPASINNFYAYLGYGRLLNAGQVIFAKNFENVLLDEGIITEKLPPDVFRKLTILLDKKHNWEFFSKYKDDADIEFFSQIEQLLLDEKIIKSQLGSRATLKLFQALTNGSFVNYPRYKGYLMQGELNYNNISFYDSKEFNNTISVILSGLYGLPVGLNTNFLFAAFVSIPVNQKSKSLLDYDFYHSPYTLKEDFPIYKPIENNLHYLSAKDTIDYIAGTKLIVFHNLTDKIGISGFLNFVYGKTNGAKNNYAANAVAQFRYNILSKLYSTVSMQLYSSRTQKMHFSTSIDFGYAIF